MTKKPSPDALAIRILSADGKEGLYIPFSQRLPEYLDQYRPEDGWRVERSVQAALELSPGLQALHVAAIQAGKEPASLGLPPLPTGLVYTAKLVDKEGRVVMTASAYGQAHDMFKGGALCKDHEAAETAAYQRLIASLGFAGGVLDQDEAVSVSLAGKVAVAQHQTDDAATATGTDAAGTADADALLDGLVPVEQSSTGQARSVKEPEKPAVAENAAVAEDQTPPAGQPDPTPVVAEAKAVEAIEVSASPKQSAPSSKQILAAKRRMITTLAKTLKVEAREVADEAAADAEIGRLSAIGQERKTS